MRVLKAVAVFFLMIRFLFDKDLRVIAILVLIKMVRRIAIPIIILGTIIILATTEARGEGWLETFEQGQEKYFDNDIVVEDGWGYWTTSYECLRFETGWSDRRPEACPLPRTSDKESVQGVGEDYVGE